MARRGRIIHQPSGQVLASEVKWCKSLVCKGLGLMFRRALRPGEGLLFVEPAASRVATTVTMIFMNFSIAVIWLGSDFRVVDKTLAIPWRLSYAPSVPAQYYLEADPALVERVAIGDLLEFQEIA